MSTLELTVNLLHTLPESDIETIYSYVQFVSMQRKKQNPISNEELKDILDSITGIIPDNGKTLEEYKAERIKDRYGIID